MKKEKVTLDMSLLADGARLAGNFRA